MAEEQTMTTRNADGITSRAATAYHEGYQDGLKMSKRHIRVLEAELRKLRAALAAQPDGAPEAG